MSASGGSYLVTQPLEGLTFDLAGPLARDPVSGGDLLIGLLAAVFHAVTGAHDIGLSIRQRLNELEELAAGGPLHDDVLPTGHRRVDEVAERRGTVLADE